MAEKVRGTFKHYRAETRRPIYAILAAAPFFVAYEIGIHLYGGLRGNARNGVETLMDWMLGHPLGRYGAILFFVTLGVAVLYHQKREESMTRETVVKGYIPALYLESLVYAGVLFLLPGGLQKWLASGALASGGGGSGASLGYDLLVTSCGAGAYEELLFRLLLLALVSCACFRLFSLPRGWSAAIAVVATSLLFSGAHYIGYSFDWPSFLFRFAAGLYFAAICTYRSFGAAVATHAFFDMMYFASQHL